MKIKTFVFTNSIDEDTINDFITENKAEVVGLTFSASHLWTNMFGNGEIVEQWNEYIGVLIYK